MRHLAKKQADKLIKWFSFGPVLIILRVICVGIPPGELSVLIVLSAWWMRKSSLLWLTNNIGNIPANKKDG